MKCDRWNREPDEIISSKVIEDINEFHQNHDQVLDCENCVYICGWDGDSKLSQIERQLNYEFA